MNSESRARTFPATELDISRVFEIEPEDRLSVGDEERAAVLATADAFFERHGIERGGAPTSLAVREGKNKARIASLAWERPGPGGTSEITRVAVLGDRVAAYDRNLRAGVPLGGHQLLDPNHRPAHSPNRLHVLPHRHRLDCGARGPQAAPGRDRPDRGRGRLRVLHDAQPPRQGPRASGSSARRS